MPEPKKPVHVSIDATVADRLDAVAEERMLGKAWVVEKAIGAFLDALPPLPGAQEVLDPLSGVVKTLPDGKH